MAAPEWTAERDVDLERAAGLVAVAAPELAGAAIVALASGWDNTVVAVGEQWAFRFPRRAVALPGVRREIAVLPRIAPLLPLPVPVPEVVGSDFDPVEPWPFTGARLLPGRELADTGLPDDGRVPLAAATGAFLRGLPARAALAGGPRRGRRRAAGGPARAGRSGVPDRAHPRRAAGAGRLWRLVGRPGGRGAAGARCPARSTRADAGAGAR